MFKKLSVAAALMFLTAGGVARAASIRTDFDAAEAGNPDSVHYADRMVSGHSPTDAEINAAEARSPDNIENKDQPRFPIGDWQAAWQAAESIDPDFG